ncbi:MAG: hypothetical protein WCK47_07855 [bacterium]
MQQMLRMQQIDNDIKQLEEKLSALPTRIQKLRQEISHRVVALEKIEKDLAAMATRRRNLETELKSAESRLERFRKQQDFVKTSKEYAAITHEIVSASENVSRLEEEILNLLESEEKTARELGEKRAAAARLDERDSAEIARLEEYTAHETELLRGVREDRIAAFNALDERYRPNYELLFKIHGPQVVAPARQEACGGCMEILVPNLLIEIRVGNIVVQCPRCRRFLYYEKES